mmetsp:Transcript_69586/g.115626  ORF Transcript_69586/g.115626 Transcript_69586/m.115626 type:complete len:97 (-) Transcript_69586:93-383(-)
MTRVNLPVRSQWVQGFMSTPWLEGRRGAFVRDMIEAVRNGVVRAHETCWDGMESWSNAFMALFRGVNTGKVVVRVDLATRGRVLERGQVDAAPCVA